MAANRGSCLPSTAKLYRVRFGPWRISSAGTRSRSRSGTAIPFWWMWVDGLDSCGGRGELALESLVEDEQVVEAAALVALRATKDCHIDANRGANTTLAVLPRAVVEQFAVGVG